MDARDRLAALHRDAAEAKFKIRNALNELALKHGIPILAIAYAMEGYADNMLSDAIYDVERGLNQEIEDEEAA